MAIDYATDLDAVKTTRDTGVTVTITPPVASAYTIEGHLNDQQERQEVGDIGFEDSEPTFGAKTADFTSLDHADTLTDAGGTVYAIQDIFNTGDGWTELKLQDTT